MTTCYVVCDTCGYEEELNIRGDHFMGGLETGFAKYKNCFKCCESAEPKFSTIEQALVESVLAGPGRPWAERKWFAFNRPLPWFDTDEEVYEYIDLILDLKGVC